MANMRKETDSLGVVEVPAVIVVFAAVKLVITGAATTVNVKL